MIGVCTQIDDLVTSVFVDGRGRIQNERLRITFAEIEKMRIIVQRLERC